MGRDLKPTVNVFNICLNSIAIEGDRRIKVFPHYKLQIVSLHPALIDAFQSFELTSEVIVYRYWEQAIEGASFSQVRTSDTEFPEEVVQIPRVSNVWEFMTPNPDIGFIVVDGVRLGHFLRKKESLALEEMVLEHRNSNGRSFSYSNGSCHRKICVL